MALTDFFRINLPYGIHINQDGEMMAFNREYRPVGINDLSVEYEKEKTSLPVYTKYKGVTNKFLAKLGEGCQTSLDDQGKICTVWFYNDRTNPTNSSQEWDRYFDKIKMLSKLQINPRSN